MRKFTEGASESYYDSEDELYRSFWDTEGSLHWGLFDESSGPAASWRRLPLLPAGTAVAAVPVNCASPGLPCLYAPARSVVIVTPGDKLTQYWYIKRLE